MLSEGRYSSETKPEIRLRLPSIYAGRPRRGISASPSWSILTPGFAASRNARSIGAPSVKPLATPAGTFAGITQPLPPLALQAPAGFVIGVSPSGGVKPHCAQVKLGLVQPIVSKPRVVVLLSTPATPTRTPKTSSSLVQLPVNAARGLKSSLISP